MDKVNLNLGVSPGYNTNAYDLGENPLNYDISIWAAKIQNEKKAHMGLMNLKKIVNGTESE